MLGKTLAHYRIVEKIGEGGMGEVYVAEDSKLGRRVALKVLPGDMASDPDRRMRFEREARSIAALNHANIVTIHSIEEADGVHFLVMELVEGETLSDRIPRNGMRLLDLFEIAVPLADALAAAHRQGITHRDLKPANIMITRENVVKVLDFGLAKLITENAGNDDATMMIGQGERTAEGHILGTVAYMSPEQAEGRPVDARTDIFSLGVILFEMATGKRPFIGETSVSTITAILRDEPPLVSEVNRALPRHLARIIKHCMAKKPDDRYHSAIDVRNELRSLKQEVTSGEHIEERPAVPVSKRRFPKVAILGIGAAIVLLAIVFGRSLLPGNKAPAPPETPTSVARDVGAGKAVGVVGFENLSDPADTEQIGRMLMGLVTTDLIETGGMSVVSSPQILAALREVHGDNPFKAADASAVARKAGAGVMLVGQVLQDGEGVILTAELIDVSSGETMGSVRERSQTRSQLFQLADALADEVRDKYGLGSAEDASSKLDLAQTLTDSPAAYRAYVAGETALQQREWDDAITHLQHAVELDSTFALGYYMLAVAAGWAEQNDLARDASIQAVRFSQRLPPRWQVVVRAKRDWEQSNYDAAYNELKKSIDAGTDIAEAHYLFGEILTHIAKYQDPDKAKASFEKALELDPSYTIVLFHLVSHWIRDDEVDDAWETLDRLAGQSSDKAVLEAKLALLKYEDRTEEAYEVARELAVTNLYGSWMEIVPLYVRLDKIDEAESVLERLLGTKPDDAFGIYLLGQLRLLQGRFRDGIALMDRAVPLFAESPGLELIAQGNLDAIGIRHAFLGEYDLALSKLREPVRDNPRSIARTYSLGRVLAVSGVDPTAKEAFDALDAIESERGTAGLDVVRTCLQAETFLAKGDAESAWRVLEAAQSTESEVGEQDVLVDRRPLNAQTIWWLRARILEARGEEEAAVSAYREIYKSRHQPRWSMQFLETRCLYPLAKLEEAIGDTESARQHYLLYVKRWGTADVPIPGIEDAKARLAAL